MVTVTVERKNIKRTAEQIRMFGCYWTVKRVTPTHYILVKAD